MTLMGNGTMRSEWNFDETIRGTVRGVPIALNLAEAEEEWQVNEDQDEDPEWQPVTSGLPSTSLGKSFSVNVGFFVGGS